MTIMIITFLMEDDFLGQGSNLIKPSPYRVVGYANHDDEEEEYNNNY